VYTTRERILERAGDRGVLTRLAATGGLCVANACFAALLAAISVVVVVSCGFKGVELVDPADAMDFNLSAVAVERLIVGFGLGDCQTKRVKGLSVAVGRVCMHHTHSSLKITKTTSIPY
jgi:hypothetical protein